MPQTAERVAEQLEADPRGARRLRAALAPAGRRRDQERPLRRRDRRRSRVRDGEFAVDEGPRADTSLERLPRLRPVHGPAASSPPATPAPSTTARRGGRRGQRAVRRPRTGCTPRARRRRGRRAPASPRRSWASARSRPRARPSTGPAGRWTTSTPSSSTRRSPRSRSPACATSGSTRRSSTPTAARSPSATRSGCSGTRILVTLLGRLERAGARRGLATMCVGVGQGTALLVKTWHV